MSGKNFAGVRLSAWDPFSNDGIFYFFGVAGIWDPIYARGELRPSLERGLGSGPINLLA